MSEGRGNVIWMYWDRGLQAAPEIVKRCVQSWIDQNPTWTVRVLDEQSVGAHIDLARALGRHGHALPIQQRTVLLRLALLALYGGVWADASVYCTRPLDAWLPEQLRAGFFAFRNPGPDRLLSNWFLAARAGDRLVTEFHEITRDFFDAQHFPRQDAWPRWRIARRLGTSFNVDVPSTRRWFWWPVRRVLRVYPYFVNHYLFDQLLLRDAACRAQWDAVPSVESLPLHALVDLAPHRLTEALAAIDAAAAPMFKLSWRVDMGTEYWRTVLAHLHSNR
jgi:Capsular polysaccharide synthesis protein